MFDLSSALPSGPTRDTENDAQEVLNLLLKNVCGGGFEIGDRTVPQCALVFNQDALPQPATLPVVHAVNLTSTGESKGVGSGTYQHGIQPSFEEQIRQTWTLSALVAISGGDTGNRAQFQSRFLAAALRNALLHPEGVEALALVGIENPSTTRVTHPPVHGYRVSIFTLNFLMRAPCHTI